MAVLAGCGGGDDPRPDAGAGEKDIVSFAFLAAQNPGLTADVSTTISGASIVATLPSGTDVRALIPTFTTTGASVTIEGTAQVSGTTAVNFTNPVTYRVTADDGSARDYVAVVTIAPLVRKAITDYRFSAAGNSALRADVNATINGTSITATVPADTDVRALVATFSTTGESVTVAGVTQVSGTTAHDFTSPVVYRVVATDGSTQDYTVAVTVAPRSAKAITDFRFRFEDNAGLGRDVVARINGTSITATVPSGTAVSALIATFSTSGTNVTVGGVAQISGTTANNFANAVTYRVAAADGSAQNYTVTVTVAPASAKAITEYRFLSADNAGLAVNVDATINGTSIGATVPAGTTVTELVATFSTTGATVTVASAAQVSGTTANNFASPVVYRVTAADGSTQDYTVTVTVAAASAKSITDYRFLSSNNPALRADVVATITGRAIVATMPAGTDVSALVATFATTGASVTVAGFTQVSGTTANNFASPVTYQVTAVDDSTQNYTVTVTVAPPSAKAITDYRFLSANNPGLRNDVVGVITGTAIAVAVPSGTNVSALVATFSTSGASVNVGNVAQVSGTTANNFTNVVTYRVVAADASAQNHAVTVTVAPPSAKAITDYRFLSANNAGLSADVRATITGTSIAATVPASADITALVATFATTGASVTVAGVVQFSGITANPMTSPVTYRVTAGDGSTQDYVVTVTVVPVDAKAITAYRFRAAENPSLTSDVVATINGTAIAAAVPFGTSVNALIATFTTTGASVTVGGVAQLSGTTANNFTGAVTYRVTATDGSTLDYTVTVTVGARDAKDITDFRFLVANNPGLTADVIGRFDGTFIGLSVPPGTNVTALIGTFVTTGVRVSVRGVTQVSGTTPNNYTDPNTLPYVVTASDGTTKNYQVFVGFR